MILLRAADDGHREVLNGEQVNEVGQRLAREQHLAAHGELRRLGLEHPQRDLQRRSVRMVYRHSAVL